MQLYDTRISNGPGQGNLGMATALDTSPFLTRGRTCWYAFSSSPRIGKTILRTVQGRSLEDVMGTNSKSADGKLNTNTVTVLPPNMRVLCIGRRQNCIMTAVQHGCGGTDGTKVVQGPYTFTYVQWSIVA